MNILDGITVNNVIPVILITLFLNNKLLADKLVEKLYEW
jgi:hypothetical protein